MPDEHLVAGVLDTDPRWIGAPRAACRDYDPEMWFPVNDGHQGTGSRIYRQIQAAKRVCATCAIQQLCLDSAIAAGVPFGVWGGMTPAERAIHAGGRVRRYGPGHLAERWSDLDVLRLRHLIAEGTPRPVAARILGRTNSAVRQACVRYGITREETP